MQFCAIHTHTLFFTHIHEYTRRQSARVSVCVCARAWARENICAICCTPCVARERRCWGCSERAICVHIHIHIHTHTGSAGDSGDVSVCVWLGGWVCVLKTNTTNNTKPQTTIT
jgi:hypothetical protein